MLAVLTKLGCLTSQYFDPLLEFATFSVLREGLALAKAQNACNDEEKQKAFGRFAKHGNTLRQRSTRFDASMTAA